MSIPLISTKLHIPAPNNQLVQRPHLIDRLNKGLLKKLTLICAPAGFGKTTIASEWLSKMDMPRAWISLDENDNDLIRFFSYLAAAFNKIDSSIGDTASEILESPIPPHYETLLTGIINELNELDHDMVLSLDDFHLITNPEIHDSMAFFLQNLPPNLHMVILSRSEPDFRISKLRSKNQLTELNVSDLRFTIEESEKFINRIMKQNITFKDIASLDERTEGWIVGLQLTALSVSDNMPLSEIIPKLSGSDRFIADYLIDEVLSRQPESVQQFLFKTSILERLCADLCYRVTGVENSQNILLDLEKSNLFTIPLDNARDWYRYHHLFRDMLRSRLKTKYPEELSELYSRAFEWHRSRNLLEEAVRYAINGRNYSQAADIIEEIGFKTYWSKNQDSFLEWLDAMPGDLLESRPELRILDAYARLRKGEVCLADKIFKNIWNKLNNDRIASENKNAVLEAKVATGLTNVSYLLHQDWHATRDWSKCALKLLPSDYYYERSLSSIYLGGAYTHLGDLDSAQQYLETAFDLCEKTANPLAKLLSQGNLGTLSFVRGDLHRALKIFRDAYKYTNDYKLPKGSPSSISMVGIGNIYYEWNQLDAALEYIDQAVNLSGQEEFLDRVLLCLEAMIQLHLAKGNHNEAKSLLKKTARMISNLGSFDHIIYKIQAIQVQMALKEDDIKLASEWSNDFSSRFKGQVACELEPELITLAQVHIAKKEFDRAIELLKKMLELAESQGRFRSVIQIETILAKAFSLAGDETAGLSSLSKALILAEPEGYLRTFIDEGEPVKTMLQSLHDNPKARSEIPLGYIRRLLDCYAPLVKPSNLKNFHDQKPPISVHLTKREREVLNLLEEGLPYEEIASRLTVSINTVRYHVKNIYGKLNVSNRTRAVALAKTIDVF